MAAMAMETGGAEGMCTLFMASICEAKERIEHLEVFFSKRLYPAIVQESEALADLSAAQRQWMLEMESADHDRREAEEEWLHEKEMLVKERESAEISWRQEKSEIESKLETALREKEEIEQEKENLLAKLRSVKRKHAELEDELQGKRQVLRSLNARYHNMKMQYGSVLRQHAVAEEKGVYNNGLRLSPDRIEDVQGAANDCPILPEERKLQTTCMPNVRDAWEAEECRNDAQETATLRQKQETPLQERNLENGSYMQTTRDSRESHPQITGKLREPEKNPQKERNLSNGICARSNQEAEYFHVTARKAATPATKKRKGTLNEFFYANRGASDGKWRSTRAQNDARDPHDDFLSTPQDQALRKIAEENAKKLYVRKNATDNVKKQNATEDGKKQDDHLRPECPRNLSKHDAAETSKNAVQQGISNNWEDEETVEVNEAQVPAPVEAPRNEDLTGPDNCAGEEAMEVDEPVPCFVPDTLALEWEVAVTAKKQAIAEKMKKPDQVTKPADNPPQVPKYKYNEPVRKKAEREALQGVECNQCKKFYDAVLAGDADGVMNTARCEHHNEVSRHRYRYVPPSTPEGFWNIGFDTETQT